MDDILVRHWDWIALRGAAAFLFGLVTLFYPEITVTALVLLFAVYAILDGVFRVAAALAKRRGEEHWTSMLLSGVLGITAGAIMFFFPEFTLLVLVLVLAGWAIVTGVLEIVAAVRLRRVIEREWFLALAGVVSVLFGVLLMALPITGALTVALLAGAYAVVLGSLLLALSLRLRGWQRTRGR
ncbi:MAG: HdeD family acid-resistance protein [Gemmatimonadota bacterium]|nr:HdeD family acid-resistance protein [Gemmatimonadota bacterium]